MTEQYSFTVDTGVWSQDNIDGVHTNLSDTMNESYVTAEEDSPSRYFSVIDSSNEMSLDNLNITLSNPKLEVEDDFIPEEVPEQVQEEPSEQQVVVFTVEGSDELFGIQVAHDEEGNLQKYQFQFRKNEEGQLEAIPETVQLLPMEEEQGAEAVPESGDTGQIFHEEEHILPEEETLMYQSEEIEDEPLDVKPAILPQNVKQEVQEQSSESLPEEIHTQIEYESPEIQEEQIQDNLTEYSNNIEETEELSQVFEHVEVRPDVAVPLDEETEETEDFNVESDENDYQIVEGLHITGDVETNEIQEKQNTVNNTNILKPNKDSQKLLKKDNKVLFYVVQPPEKENVDSLSLEMSNLCRPKVNPRSILKSSHAMFQLRNEEQDDRINKRFGRCKEAMQARLLHNFINKTTIPQAPIRKNRLPRKQKIKPVERMDEEIVVEEVMVSSFGFMEPYPRELNFDSENFEVTDYVELTDSDEEYDPKKNSKKKKKHKKKVEIEISDDSDSSVSIIELNETDEDEPKTTDTPSKRRRGRPPKNQPVDSPAKKTRLDTTENPSKPEIPCPKCDKTFPSQNSLKTHLQHHNLQSSIKNALPESKYKCDDCAISFKNPILLKNHKCFKFSCPVCKKKFPDTSSLTGHKRIHAKEHLLKSTAGAQVSPKLKPQLPSTQKSPKCRICGKLCSSIQNLNVHVKTHREYVCGSCSTSFVSQLMLEKHVRESCVKSTRRSMRIRSVPSPPKSPKKSPMSTIKIKCEQCGMQMGSYKALFRHKVVRHNLETPDKSVLEKEKIVKGAHGGVPAAKRLQNAWAKLRTQLDFCE